MDIGENDVGLVCARLPSKPHVPGFVGECYSCKAKVNVSYTGHGAALDAAREHGGRVVTVCLECSAERCAGNERVSVSDEQIRQVEGILGRKISQEERDNALAAIKAALGRGRHGESQN
jgi:hypothetical protein